MRPREVGQRDVVAVLVGQREVGGLGAWLDHRSPSGHFSSRESRRSLRIAALRLAVRAVGHDVVLVEDRLERPSRSAGRARPGGRGRCVGLGNFSGSGSFTRPRRPRARGRARRPSPSRSAVGLLLGEVVAALERREHRGVQDLVDPGAADAGDHLLVAQQRVQRARWTSAARASVAGGSGQASGPSVAARLGLEPSGASSLTQAACLVPNSRSRSSRFVRQPPQHARGAVAHRAALVEQLQPPRAHQVGEERERPARRRCRESSSSSLPRRRTPVNVRAVERAAAAGRTS